MLVLVIVIPTNLTSPDKVAPAKHPLIRCSVLCRLDYEHEHDCGIERFAGKRYLYIPRMHAPRLLFALLALALAISSVLAQSGSPESNDAVRVSVTLNEDGSRTTYQFDPANHKATATTTEHDGKARGKIEYGLDDAGRFGSGRIFGADGKFLFRTVYKYDAAGRLQEESRFGKDDRPSGKLIYSYDAAGKQTGYAVYDSTGKLLGQTSTPAPSAKPRKAGR